MMQHAQCTIVYAGPAEAGKSTNLRHLRQRVACPGEQGELSLRPPAAGGEGLILSFEARREVEEVIHVATVPGRVFEEAGRRELLAAADAVIFVVDSSPKRSYAVQESWESLSRELAELKRRPPIVVQYNKRDVADALSRDELRRVLGLQPFHQLCGQPVANPLASLPQVDAVARDGSGVVECFEAALAALRRAASRPNGDVTPLAMHQVDQAISTRLAEVFPFLSADEVRRALQGGEASRTQLKQQIVAGTRVELEERLLERLESDPEFQARLADQMADEVGDLVVARGLRCPRCGNADEFISTFLRPKPGAEVFKPGDSLGVSPAAVPADLYVTVKPCPRDGPFEVLESWACTSCGAKAWATIVIDVEGRLLSVWPAVFNRETFLRSHFVASECALRAAELAAVGVETLDGPRVVEILRQLL